MLRARGERQTGWGRIDTPGGSLDDRWRFVVDGLSRFAGRELAVDEEVLASAQATARNAARV